MKPLPHKKARRMQPRPVVNAPPIVVSDQTAFDLVGLTSRQLRDLLACHRDVPRVVMGQRVLVRADALLALLDRLAATDSDGPALAAHDEEEMSADAILALVGRRRA